MISVKNVKKINNRLSADYYYRDPSDIGHVTLDVNTGEILQRQPNEEDNSRAYSYFGKVIQFLEMMIKADNYPESADFIWY